jgi:hypothetical protein
MRRQPAVAYLKSSVVEKEGGLREKLSILLKISAQHFMAFPFFILCPAFRRRTLDLWLAWRGNLFGRICIGLDVFLHVGFWIVCGFALYLLSLRALG